MTCARGCCYTGLGVCARQRVCDCHWGEAAPARTAGGADATYNDPTARQAIANVMKQERNTK
jgi:hypothetical protein